MKTYNDNLILQFDDQTTGNAASGELVTVFDAGLATKPAIFDVFGSPIANPLTTDVKGNFAFQVADGVYDVVGKAGTPDETRRDKVEIIEQIAGVIDRLNPDTLEIWQNDTSSLAGEVVTTKERSTGNGGGAIGDVISGTGTVDGGGIITHNSLSLSLEFRIEGSVSAEVYGLIGDGAVNNTTQAQIAKDADIELILTNDKTYLVDDDFVFGPVSGNGQIKTTTETKLPVVTNGKSNDVSVIDMHFGVLRGTPWNGVEGGGTINLNITSAVPVGDNVVNVTSNTGITNDMLMVFLSDDGLFFTNTVLTSTATTITFRDKMTKAVSTGLNLWNFYNDRFHGNIFGWKALADAFVDDDQWAKEFIEEIDPEIIGTAVLATSATDNAFNCGSSSAPATEVTINAISDGVRFDIGTDLESGRYVVSVRINATAKSLKVKLAKLGGDFSFQDTDYTTQTATTLNMEFFVSDNAQYVLDITDETLSSGTFIVSDVRFYKRRDLKPNLNSGKHVLFGDSWLVLNGGGFGPRVQERLPNAEIVIKGVGGNNASQLSARFDNDVTPEAPDFVWVIVGTNDYSQSVTVADFSFFLNKLKAQCAEIGAQMILITSSVGSAVLSAAEFDLSRQYLEFAYYWDGFQTPVAPVVILDIDTVSLTKISVANGATIRFGHRGLIDGDITLTEHFFKILPTTTETLRLVEATDLDAGVTGLATLNTGLVTTDVNVTTSTNRFVFFEYINSSGIAQTIEGYSHIVKTQ